MKLNHALIAASAALTLAACGDNPPDATPTPQASNEVPASATVSTTSYVQYTASLPANDTQEPLDVRKVVPPTSETEAPISVL